MSRAGVLVVEREPVLRQGLCAAIARDAELEVVGEAGDAMTALEVAAEVDPDLAVVTTRLRDTSLASLCQALREQVAAVDVLVLADGSSRGELLDALAARVRGLVEDTSGLDVLCTGLRALARGEAFVDPVLLDVVLELAATGRDRRGPYGLTGQELRVLGLVRRGWTNRRIAEELGVSPETIKTHVAGATAKLGAHDRHQAAARAEEHGLI